MPRIVILGGGFAGLAAARELQHRRREVRGLEIVLIDRNNFMTFTPLLPEASSGAVDLRAVTQPLRALLPHVRVELGEVLSVDERVRTVAIRHPLTHASCTIAYDELIFALGSVPSSMGIEGVDRYTIPLRSVSDAQRLRSLLVDAMEVAAETNDLVERDRLLRFVIVGGGFTGVEAAGELTAFLRAALQYYPSLQGHQPQVVLIQGEGRLLPHLPERYGKYAASVLSRRGVDIRINANVSAVDGVGVTLADGQRYDARTILWDAGTEPAPFVKRLGLKLSKHHAIVTQRDFSIEDHPHLWAIGDCAAVPKARGGTYAPLAQNATREGPLARAQRPRAAAQAPDARVRLQRARADGLARRPSCRRRASRAA